MKMPSWPVLLGFAALVIAGVILSIMSRLGSFKDVVIERKKDIAPITVLSREHLGAYHKIAGMLTEMETWARAHDEPCAVTFGEYYDDPRNVDEDRLRARGGCVFANAESAERLRKILSLSSEAAANPKSETVMRIESVVISDALVASFEGAPSIGPLKVYPKVFEQMKDLDLVSNGPVLELYEVLNAQGGRTRYYFPVKSTRAP